MQRVKLLKIFTPVAISTLVLASGQGSNVNQMSFSKLGAELQMKYSQQNGKKEKYNLFSTKVMIASELELSKYISASVKAGFNFETGSTQTSNDDKRYTPNSKLVYDYLTINVTPISFITLNAGALSNKGELAPGSIVNYGVSNMGLRQSINYDNRFINFSLIADQSKPYNDELSSRIESVDEGSPKFFRETISLELKSHYADFKIWATSFAYEDLSSSVAYNDAYYGNTVTRDNETNSFYNYTFKGKAYSPSLTLKYQDKASLELFVEKTKNDKAPESANEADIKGLGIKSKIFDYKVSAWFTKFSNESDTTPAFYTRTHYKNGFEGNLIKLKITDNNKTDISINYVKRYQLNKDLDYLDDERVISIELRKLHDFI